MKNLVFLLFALVLSLWQANAQGFSPLIPPAKPKYTTIKQFEDDGLAHFSYAVQAEDKIILVDPGRDPQPYYDYAKEQGARIVGVIETHPHADFISSHLEIRQQMGAVIYTSSLVGASYPHQAFDEGNVIKLSAKVSLKALNTPGHSPDGISVLVEEEGKDIAVFTGDTMFIGDVGRPDLRENAGNIHSERRELAKMMYYSTREKLMKLADDVVVFPAHGAGSLCGKAISDANFSTIGHEKMTNYALQEMSEQEFVELLLQDQPFIPQYFPYNVEVNRNGAKPLLEAIGKVKLLENNFRPSSDALLIDGRNQSAFKASHVQGAINIMDGAKFETWLGSLVKPGQKFYLLAGNENQLKELLAKTSKIGYEEFVLGAFVYDDKNGSMMEGFDKLAFDADQGAFTVLDIRNRSEVANGKVFAEAINIPLPELAERLHELPGDKPIVVHCGTGYRSAAGSSILKKALKDRVVLDMGAAILDYNRR